MSARKPPPDVRVGDVWASTNGRNRIRVDVITHGRYVTGEVCWTSLSVRGAGPVASGVCALDSFARTRRLVERDGKPVAAEAA